MLLTLSPFEPFKQNPHPAALADLSLLSPEAMVGSPASSSLLPQELSPFVPAPSRLNPSPSASAAPSNHHHHHHHIHHQSQQQEQKQQQLQSQPQSRPTQLKRKRSEEPINARPAKRAAMDADAQPGADLDDTKAKSPDEKKRNKLGYHRTSVACSHCRRRKIRCMIPDNDTTGRCANCIRLKKECTFCPVEESGTSRGARSAVPGAPSSVASSKNQSPETILKSSQISPSVPTLQSRPQFMSPASLPPGGLGIFESPHSSIHDQSHWYPPNAGWERTSPLGVESDYAPNYNLSQQPLNSPFTVTPHGSMHGQMGPEMTPQSDDSQVPQSAHPYAPNLALRTDLSWAQPGQSVHSSRSLSHGFPHTMSPQPSLDSSSMPRRAATLPGPIPPQMNYMSSATPSTMSEPMSLPNSGAQTHMMPPEWQPVEWNMAPHNQDATFKSGGYSFDASWYQHNQHAQQQQQQQQQQPQQQSHGSGPPPY